LIPVQLRLIALLAGTLSMTASNKPKLHIQYYVSVDAADPSSIWVRMQIENAPRSLRLAMAVHPEYNDRFWRYVRDWHVDSGDRRALLAVDRDNVWRLLTHYGFANLSYRIQLPRENPTSHPVWHTFLRADGGSINTTDTFIYLADFPDAEVDIQLGVPVSVPGHVVWDVPGGNSIMSDGRAFWQDFRTDAATLLDSPMLYGSTLRFWYFDVGGIPHTIAYWPLPNATPFDTAQFVDAIKKVVSEAVAVFGKPPYPHYFFLLEDGAFGALEHANSVTIGMPSSDLARDPRAYLGELAHEFFHTWNLVRLYPEGRGTPSDRDPEHATGLWLSEGITMYYAEVLTRRAGFPERGRSRSDLLAEEVESYYGSPGNTLISPEVASERAVDTTGINGDYEANYYVQGRLIGTAIDLIISDSTNGRRGLDDLMRALYARYAMKRGFTTDDVERAASETCGCNMHRFFDDYVRNAHPLDFNRYLGTIGLRVLADTIPAADSTGARLPDIRVWAYPPKKGGRMRVMIQDPSSVWAKAGLHTGDELVAFNGAPIDSFPDFRRAFRAVKLGDVVPVSITRGGTPSVVNVRVTGYDRPRVRIIEAPDATAAQRERRRLWLTGSAAHQ
jgi:predicted metalloprotease with PDZ domain